MKLTILENGLEINDMERVFKFGMMDLCMKDSGKKTRLVVKGD